MRLLLASLVLAMPALSPGFVAAQQDPIPEGVLQEHTRACVSQCMENRERDFCIRTCDCVAGEMRNHWTADEYRQREAGLSGQQSPQVQEELRQMSAYCARASQ